MSKFKQGDEVLVIPIQKNAMVTGISKILGDERIKCIWFDGSKKEKGYYKENELEPIIKPDKSTFIPNRF